jgi:hypothetical protein
VTTYSRVHYTWTRALVGLVLIPSDDKTHPSGATFVARVVENNGEPDRLAQQLMCIVARDGAETCFGTVMQHTWSAINSKATRRGKPQLELKVWDNYGFHYAEPGDEVLGELPIQDATLVREHPYFYLYDMFDDTAAFRQYVAIGEQYRLIGSLTRDQLTGDNPMQHLTTTLPAGNRR